MTLYLAAIEDAQRRWRAALADGDVQANRARYIEFGLWPLIENERAMERQRLLQDKGGLE